MEKDYSELREEDSVFILEMYLCHEGLIEMRNGKTEFTRRFLRRDEVRELNHAEIRQKEKEARESLKSVIEFLNGRRNRNQIGKGRFLRKLKKMLRKLFPPKYVNFEGQRWN